MSEVSLEQIIGLAGLAIQGGGFAYLLGKHSQRLNTNERDIDHLKVKTDEHSNTVAGIPAMIELLKEVRDDVKGLMTGRTPVRRQREGD